MSEALVDQPKTDKHYIPVCCWNWLGIENERARRFISPEHLSIKKPVLIKLYLIHDNSLHNLKATNDTNHEIFEIHYQLLFDIFPTHEISIQL